MGAVDGSSDAPPAVDGARRGRTALTAEQLRSAAGVEAERPEAKPRSTDLDSGEHRCTISVGGALIVTERGDPHLPQLEVRRTSSCV
jgi:hypothetical protein